MTERTDSFGDPTEWDLIPEQWTEAFTTAIQAHGHTVTDAHDEAIAIDVPGLDEGHEWYIGKPNFHGMWSYGVANERGVCDMPQWILADASDPQDVADTVHAILTGAPLRKFWTGGAFAVYPEPDSA
ncbi:hypothetical protein [Streptomyces marispadix]|uniref:DUF317 domain-containing protein n=1 Tax=Streptomyces marispadix TaxID=2922868 RepID=A0ABS9T0F4_9ACTN|nr:hypothetical protein [Streptomyces marispadix]MCH6162016.1 hypothetical protein [Streptomyces marispadix]